MPPNEVLPKVNGLPLPLPNDSPLPEPEPKEGNLLSLWLLVEKGAEVFVVIPLDAWSLSKDAPGVSNNLPLVLAAPNENEGAAPGDVCESDFPVPLSSSAGSSVSSGESRSVLATGTLGKFAAPAGMFNVNMVALSLSLFVNLKLVNDPSVADKTRPSEAFS